MELVYTEEYTKLYKYTLSIGFLYHYQILSMRLLVSIGLQVVLKKQRMTHIVGPKSYRIFDRPRETWLDDYCAQLSLLATQIIWTEDGGSFYLALGNGMP